MGISVGGYGDYGSAYQNYRMPEIKTQDIKAQEPEESQQVQTAAADGSKQVVTEETAPAAKRQDASLEDVSLTFNKQDDYGYIGKDSDILSLDVEKAVSDMRKDQILQQYQYFVGGKY